MLSETELHKLILDMRNLTALGRLSLGEVEEAFARLAELGYVIKAPVDV
ncbi:hypothetical protein [Bradyrhizobium zhanjiangense]|nr:hypothetical protein [Bradyrhizobium zhanjiangense]